MPHQCTGCGYTFADGSKEMLGGCPDCGGNKFQFHPEGTDVPDTPDDAAPPDQPADPSDAASTVGRAATKVRDFVSGSTDDSAPSEESPHPDDPSPTDDPVAADSSAAAADDHPSERNSESSATRRTTRITADEDPDPDAPWPDSGADTEDADADELPTDADGIIDADAHATTEVVEEAEDYAQANARSEIASEREVPDAGTTDSDSTGETTPGPDSDPEESLKSDASELGGDESTVGPPADNGRVVSEPSGEEADIEELREQLNDQFESIKIVEPGQYELNLMELYDRDEYIIALQENGRYVIQVPEQWIGDRET